MIAGLELVDILKKLKNNEPGHTFHHHAGSSRLDRIYASQMFADNFKCICLKPVLISDHQSIQSNFKCNLDLSRGARSSAFLWKLNTLILSEEVFQNQITQFILQSSWHPLREKNVANWWESVLKPGIKRISIAYCRQRARMIRETRSFYQTCFHEISQIDPFDWVASQELMKYSKSWEESTLRGFGIRCRCFDGPDTEEANIFHVNRAKDNFGKCSFEKIIAPDGRVLTSKEYVSREMISHFTSIFKNQPSSVMLAGTEFLGGVRDCCKPAPNLTAPISILEIKSAHLETKKNKSRGIDGIPYKFYLTFGTRLPLISWICLTIIWKGIPLHHHRDKRLLD
ncbi:hypothetical protein DAPPUDRAFT_333423 [Daphnia pulex]|uniref:Uncharacterized protein n=1 Tax=Daphnia pulex TaxID=6669 RepID=E9HSS3_DAPPU|nr:hypothetical protein DAPPUDRAFT_333423 [Daphnia pulex]|eukprot:EFX65213.1 hypothetical protein DAPPUDRAFT_333423 [Daphnia pulex]